MKCPQCHTDNPAAAKFCGGCGTSLTLLTCLKCQFVNPTGFKFCGGCGTRITSEQPAADLQQLQRKEIYARDAERRQITIMFCDLVGSTALSTQLDPEDLRELIRDYRDACLEVFQHFDGDVVRFIGDGIMAHFGYPKAYENNAERAVRAGLGILDAIYALNAKAKEHRRPAIAVRIGIATGPVVVGTIPGDEVSQRPEAVGETPNLAARIQDFARQNTIVIAPSTKQLLGGLFEYEDVGEHTLRGFPDPVHVWLVTRAIAVESRFEAIRNEGFTAFVNREKELALLIQRWRKAKQGYGQVVLLSGEAGIGKSRIARMLRERIADEPYTHIRLQGSPYHNNSALYPLINHLEHAATLSTEDSATDKFNKLETLLSRVGIKQHVQLFAALLSIPTTNGYPSLNLTPQEQKDRTFDALIDYLIALTAETPVILLLEDVHWVDPTSLELFDLIVQRASKLPVLAIVTYRQESDFAPRWMALPYVTTLALKRLSRIHTEALIAKVAANCKLPQALINQIVARTDGIPLFVEELTKTLLDAGLLDGSTNSLEPDGTLPSLAIPATLQDSLTARLYQLSSIKAIAQIGAVIGRKFSFELISAISPFSENNLSDGLDQLIASELIFRHGRPPRTSYVFKHALVQEAAYNSLLRDRRREIHAQVAKLLEEQFPQLWTLHPEVLAHHHMEAGQIEKAIPFWLQAGQIANKRSADVEAANHFARGLRALETLPETDVRRQHELNLLVPLASALINTRGAGVPEVGQTYTRALKLCDQLPESSMHFAAHWGWWRISRNFQTMHERAEKLLQLSETLHDEGLRLQAHHSMWASLFNLGHQQTCLDHIEKGLALYEKGDYLWHASIYGGHDAKVCAHGENGLALWLLGYPDQALIQADAALAWSQKIAHAGSRVHALDYALMLHRYRRDAQAIIKHIDELLEFARERSFADYRARGLVFRGWATMQLGDVEQGIHEMVEGIETQRATATLEDFPIFLDMLAEGYRLISQPEKQLPLLDEALKVAVTLSQHHWLSELYRNQGEALLASPDHDDAKAEQCFLTALEITTRQNTKSLQLRAAIGLANMWHRQGKAEQALSVLVPVDDQISEGVETLDMQEARALRHTLESTVQS